MEGLNEYVAVEKRPHPQQDQALYHLHSDFQIHQTEIAYRLENESPKESEGWPIAKYILRWQRADSFDLDQKCS